VRLRWVLAVGLVTGVATGCTLDRAALHGSEADAAGADAVMVEGDSAADRDAATEDAAFVDAAPDAAGCGAGCDAFVPFCVAGARACSADGREARLCRDDESGEDTTACPRGCDGVSHVCRPETACAVASVVALTAGDTLSFDTCGFGDDWTIEPGDPLCGGGVANGEDRIFRLNVDADGRYRIEARDADASRRVDPVVYLRTACADQATQFACDDDVTASDVDASLDVMLDAGDYFLVVDGYDYAVPSTDFTCGTLEIQITQL
jgi:hypothetical protein